MGPEGGAVALVLNEPINAPNVQARFDLVYTLLGKVRALHNSALLFYGPDAWWKAFEFPMPYAANPEHYAFGKASAQLFTQLLREGKLKTTPLKLVPNGLTDVGEWLEYMKQGKVGVAI